MEKKLKTTEASRFMFNCKVVFSDSFSYLSFVCQSGWLILRGNTDLLNIVGLFINVNRDELTPSREVEKKPQKEALTRTASYPLPALNSTESHQLPGSLINLKHRSCNGTSVCCKENPETWTRKTPHELYVEEETDCLWSHLCCGAPAWRQLPKEERDLRSMKCCVKSIKNYTHLKVTQVKVKGIA